jgi:hypothetical protein
VAQNFQSQTDLHKKNRGLFDREVLEKKKEKEVIQMPD